MRVKDILNKDGLEGCQLVAGKYGINREVTSVSVLEVTDERIKNWVIEGEIYITAFYSILDNVELQKKVIKSLYEANASALIICHMDIILKSLDVSVINLCNELSFPLIIAESNKSYVDIINPIYEKLQNNKAELKVSMMDVLKDFICKLDKSKDALESYKYFEEKYGESLYIYDIENNLTYPSTVNIQVKTIAEELLNLFLSNFESPVDEFRIIEYDSRKYIGKYITENGKVKAILIAKVKHDINYSMDFVDVIAIAGSLLHTNEIELSQARNLSEEKFVQDLLFWNFKDYTLAEDYAKKINWDISKTDRLIVVNISNTSDQSQLDSIGINKYISEVLLKNIKKQLKSESNLYISSIEDNIYIFVDKEWDRKILDKFTNDLLEYLKTYELDNVSIGISDIYQNIREIQNANMEAELAFRLSKLFLGNYEKLFFEDVNHYRNLNLKYLGIKRSNIRDTLIQKGKTQGEELFETVCQMVLNDFDVEKVSEVLYVHKNTVYNRNQKIISLLGYDLYKMPYLLNTIMDIVNFYLR